jgi:hypothetical protein
VKLGGYLNLASQLRIGGSIHPLPHRIALLLTFTADSGNGRVPHAGRVWAP